MATGAAGKKWVRKQCIPCSVSRCRALLVMWAADMENGGHELQHEKLTRCTCTSVLLTEEKPVWSNSFFREYTEDTHNTPVVLFGQI